MRVGKRSAEVDFERNERPDHGFLIRIGRSTKAVKEKQLQQTFGRKKANLTEDKKVDKSLLVRVGRSGGPPPGHKRQKSGSNAFFLTRVGRAKRKRNSLFL